MKQSLYAMGKDMHTALAVHPLWRFSRPDAQRKMQRFFLERMLKQRKKSDPHILLSCGVDTPSLTVLLAAWKLSLCDALVTSSAHGVVLFDGLQRKVTLIEKAMLEYHPGKQYDYVYYWQTENDAMLTTKYMQHIHLLLSWGGEGLFVVSQMPYRLQAMRLLSLFRKNPKSELSTLTDKITHSGFSILDVRPVECVCPLVRSAWLDMCVWHILSIFQYSGALSPFVTRVGIHFKKV